MHALDAKAAATFLSEILGLDAPTRFAPFWLMQTVNGVSLDYLQSDPGFDVQHLAFLVSEPEFDAMFGRIRQRGLPY